METLKYDYKPKITAMALAMIFFGVCAVVGWHSAQTNDRGLIIDGLITLDTGQATIFYWGLMAVSVVMAAGGLFGIVRGMTSTQTLVMDDTALRLPKSALSQKIVTVPYRDIVRMTAIQIKSQRFLRVEYAGGKVNITRSMLPSNAIFDKVCETLAARVQAVRVSPAFTN